MKKISKWIAVMLAVVITISHYGTSVSMSTVEASEYILDDLLTEDDEQPEIITGWYRLGDDWYYNDLDGNKVFGWKKIEDVWYYFDEDNTENPGVMLKNCRCVINGNTYFFAQSGAMQKGWVKRAEGWYYAETSGAMYTGWKKINGYWYYLDGNNEVHPGLMVGNCKKVIGRNTYHFNASGMMQTGWHRNGGVWYYLETSGLEASGWRKVNGSWYYLNPANGNKMATYWQKVGSVWYYFGSDGSMKQNWQKVNNEWYYFGSDGAMRHGWQKIGYALYYFYWKNDPNGGSEGAMAKNRTIGGYKLLANGAMQENYIDVNLTTQHMVYVKDGVLLMESDVVTGLPTDSRRTPPGEYKITEKKRNKVLTGNIDPSTGQPEYRTPVAYWMRITSSGIGFHDATWQPKFGGDWYKTHGSHGCINMPYSAAEKLYNLVSVGTKTIIHY